MTTKKQKIKVTTMENIKLSTVKLNWKEVYYTNCPLVSASNVDQELGWAREEWGYREGMGLRPGAGKYICFHVRQPAYE